MPEKRKCPRCKQTRPIAEFATNGYCKACDSERKRNPSGPKAELAKARAIIADFMDLVRGSDGIVGWHKNGDVAEWDEFEFVQAAEELLAGEGVSPT